LGGVRYHALVAAAGIGRRFGAESPKQYAMLDGRPVLAHAIERLQGAFPLHATYVALSSHDRWFDRATRLPHRIVPLRCGGDTRAATVRNALDALPDVAPDDWIVVHDAVRPCTDAASLLRLRTELADDPVGGLLAVPAASTLKRADESRRSAGTVSRDALWQAQTPQMFRCHVLRAALAQADIEHITDEAQAVETLGLKPRIVMGSRTNLKLTFPEDLGLVAAVLAVERETARRSA
jgi:2-C-methyl-D-erythritol 4-phosphate cytidylyltransferase